MVERYPEPASIETATQAAGNLLRQSEYTSEKQRKRRRVVARPGQGPLRVAAQAGVSRFSQPGPAGAVASDTPKEVVHETNSETGVHPDRVARGDCHNRHSCRHS